MYPQYSREAFELLCKGRHLSAADGVVFHDLYANQDSYQGFFAAIGFNLECDPRGFAYFAGESEGTIARNMERAALFVFLFVDYLSDKGVGIEEGLFGGQWHRVENLGFLADPRRETLLKESGLGLDDDRTNILRYMARTGFLVYDETQQTIQFASPTRRIIDVALNAAPAIKEGGDNVEDDSNE